MSKQQHVTTVAKSARSRNRWFIECAACGVVGNPQEFKADAEAIAKRHRDVSGFERPSIAPR